MDLLTLIAIIAVVAFIGFFFLADADLTLLYCERFGVKPETLRGKVVWITGASSGIGEYLAYELAASGCKLVLSARRKDELERVKKECLARGHLSEGDVLILPMDLLDFESHSQLAQQIIQHFKQIDVLVNNAGRSQRASAVNTELKVDQALMEINFHGTLSITKAVLPHMRQRNSGMIVVTSSIAGKVASPVSATYSASKFALHGYFDALRMELYSDNIQVQIVCPGPVLSNITKYALTETGKDWGKLQEAGTKRMKTKRCAELMVIGMANGLHELWITIQPILLYTYFGQYMPYWSKKIGILVGQKMIKDLKEDRSPY